MRSVTWTKTGFLRHLAVRLASTVASRTGGGGTERRWEPFIRPSLRPDLVERLRPDGAWAIRPGPGPIPGPGPGPIRPPRPPKDEEKDVEDADRKHAKDEKDNMERENKETKDEHDHPQYGIGVSRVQTSSDIEIFM